MSKKFIAVIGIVALLVALLPASVAGADGPVGPPTTFPRNSMAPAGPDPMDLSVEMLGEDEIAIRKYAAQVGSAVASNVSPSGQPASVGDEITVTVSDNGAGVDYDEDFVVALDGTHGIILITKDAYDSFDGTYYHFANPNGDGSTTFLRTEDLLTPGQLSYLLDEFDNNIYPTDTSIFGEPLARGAEGQKTWILIFNIRDEAYYDPAETTYIAGYFSASESAANNKNIMHIDTYDWANRTALSSTNPLYEGVFAHEFEHLIHFDIDPDEPSWVDEGLADLAGFLCGYGHPGSHLAYYMVYHPYTSLTFWGGGLEDYGASYLFELYLYEKFGGSDFVSALVQEQANGIQGIENTLAAFGYSDTFDEIFDNWTIANYLDSDKKGDKYGYVTLDIGSADSWGYNISYVVQNFWWGPPDEAPFTIPSYLYGDPQPYTAQYYQFFNKKAATLTLDGEDFAGTLPNSGTYEWYSGADAWAWRSFGQTFTIPAGGATLNFMTFFDIEEDWDFGYVEVYDQNTGEWYTLEAPGITVNYDAFGQDNPNVPAGREPMDYEAAGRWNAFTGSSGGWIPVSMDLTPFAGDTIDLYFRTWQDGAFTLQMMYVDDISIPELGFSDDVESGQDGWTADGWFISDGKFANGFGVTTIDTKWVADERYPDPATNSANPLHKISSLTVDPVTQYGTDKVSATKANSGHVKVSIVTNHADHILNSGYLFDVK